MGTGNSVGAQKRFVRLEKPISVYVLPIAYVSLVILAIMLPLLFWQLKLIDAAPFVNFTRPNGIPFELFGGLISFALLLITWIEVKRRKIKDLAAFLPIILGLLVTLTCSFNIAESTFNSRLGYDYIAFEDGAKAILSGINPYLNDKTPYVYPPLVGQALAFSYQVISRVPLLSPRSEEQGWGIVFYFFQCIQLLLIPSAYFLTYKLARTIGLKSIPASLIVTALFLFNDTVVRTLIFQQTNLWILNCFLIGILFQQSHPYVSGFAAAFGVHVKMYPFILMLPWIVLRKWRLLTGAIVGLVGIAVIQTNLGRDWTLLRYFFDYMKVVSKPTPYRNNSINSVVYNFFKIPDKLFSTSFALVPTVVTVITLAIGVWFLLRFIRREGIYRKQTAHLAPDKQAFWNERFRLYGHSMDAIALGLLISPSVYEHHFIVAIPIALWAIAARRLDKPIAVGFSIFLIFCIPTFDLFPLSFHKLVGLLMLIHLTDPEPIHNYFKWFEKRNLMTDPKNLVDLA